MIKNVTLVIVIWAVVGCSQGGLSKSVATDVVQKALDGQKICQRWLTSDPNKELLFTSISGANVNNTFWLKNEQRVSEYQQAGLVDVRPALQSAIKDPKSVAMDTMLTFPFSKTNDLSLVRVAITEVGKKFFDASRGGFCGGRHVVTDVVNWSEPAADASGMVVSQVTFNAKVEDIPKQIKVAITGATAANTVGVLQIKKMSDGWMPNQMLRFEPVKVATKEKEMPVASALKTDLSHGQAFVGTIDCAGKELGYAVQFKPGDANAATAVTNFYPTAKNPDLKNGCFTSKGAFYGGSGVLAMQFDSWLQHPAGYTASNASAVLHGDSLEVTLPINGCKAAVLVRGKLPESTPSSCNVF